MELHKWHMLVNFVKMSFTDPLWPYATKPCPQTWLTPEGDILHFFYMQVGYAIPTPWGVSPHIVNKGRLECEIWWNQTYSFLAIYTFNVQASSFVLLSPPGTCFWWGDELKGASIPKNSIPYQTPKSMKKMMWLSQLERRAASKSWQVLRWPRFVPLNLYWFGWIFYHLSHSELKCNVLN